MRDGGVSVACPAVAIIGTEEINCTSQLCCEAAVCAHGKIPTATRNKQTNHAKVLPMFQIVHYGRIIHQSVTPITRW